MSKSSAFYTCMLFVSFGLRHDQRSFLALGHFSVADPLQHWPWGPSGARLV